MEARMQMESWPSWNADHESKLCINSLDFPSTNIEVETEATNLDSNDGRIASLAIQLQALVPRCLGFTFPESPNWCSPLNPAAEDSKGNPKRKSRKEEVDSSRPPHDETQENQKPRRSITRIRPPGDLVRLEDRLYFVLQPPLENLVQTAQLTFPFQPFPYQYEGVAFLFPRAAAILADEMGLGKTMQAITAIRMLLLSGEIKSVLLICPKPLVTNWVREFRQWAPEVPVAVIEGDQAKRRWIWNHPQAPVKIANYELMMRDYELLDELSLDFELVVLDEAQRIKNRNSSTAEIIRGIRRSRSWALTGTPIENSTEDLVSIFEFLSPGYLTDDMHLKSLCEATRDFILRRTKDKVLTEMPPKLFRDVELDLTAEQWDAYRSAEEEGVMKLTDMGESLTIQHVFELVLRLKQICNMDPATGASSKLERLEADLEEVQASGQKAIVFSQWVNSLDAIGERLARFNPLYYHGRVPSKHRDAVIEKFKTDPKHSVILMSYGAGAVGLNLQFCHYVFLFDRWWNPAIEDQAINRAHRLGVKSPVTICRMMVMNTIEERIHGVLEEKRALIDTLFAQSSKPTGLGLSQREVFGLFNLTPPKVYPKAA
jgi:SNF2 family DNA or RNA helicase